MKREILCPKCSMKYALHPDDVHMGVKMRKVEILANTPPDHGVTVVTKDETGTTEQTFHPMENMRCDHCDRDITDGERVFAVTTWKNNQPTPNLWEEQFGKVISA